MYIHILLCEHITSSRSREPVSSYGYGVFTDTIIIAIDGGSRTSSQTAEQILGTSSSITWQETLTPSSPCPSLSIVLHYPSLSLPRSVYRMFPSLSGIWYFLVSRFTCSRGWCIDGNERAIPVHRSLILGRS